MKERKIERTERERGKIRNATVRPHRESSVANNNDSD
jgi:hypothetical protein